MDNKFCSVCKEELAEGSDFCTNCGAEITDGQADCTEKELVTVPACENTAEENTGALSESVMPDKHIISEPPQSLVSDCSSAMQHAVQVQTAASAADENPPDGKYAPISTAGYVGMMLLMILPVINIVFLIVWACGCCKKINKRSWARASLIMVLIGVIAAAIITIAGVIITPYIIDNVKNEFDISSALSDIYGGSIPDSDILGSVESYNDISGYDYSGEGSGVELTAEDTITAIDAAQKGDKQTLLDLGYSEKQAEQLINSYKFINDVFGSYAE